MSQEQRKRHELFQPGHVESILTSKHFASEEKFIKLARSLDKVVVNDGIEEFLNPYKSKMRKRKDQEEEKVGQ